MNVASIYVLERKLIAAGRNADVLWQSPDDWGDDLGPALDEWIAEVAESLAYAIVAAIAVIDVETVIIDGAFPEHVRTRIVDRTREAVGRVNRQGLSPVPADRGHDRQCGARDGRRISPPTRQLHPGSRSPVQGKRLDFCKICRSGNVPASAGP